MKIILCQNCHQSPMEISFTHIYNGKREDYLLCKNCARSLQMHEKFASFLTQFTQPVQEEKKDILLEMKPQLELDAHQSKILALTMEKEAAVAAENFDEAARIQKLLASYSG
jgi:protein-arginine kinase activator protein McsA